MSRRAVAGLAAVAAAGAYLLGPFSPGGMFPSTDVQEAGDAVRLLSGELGLDEYQQRSLDAEIGIMEQDAREDRRLQATLDGEIGIMELDAAEDARLQATLDGEIGIMEQDAPAGPSGSG